MCTTVEGEDEASALRTGLVAVRSAAHHAGAATPGWEADLDKVRATVQQPPALVPLRLAVELPTLARCGGTGPCLPRRGQLVNIEDPRRLPPSLSEDVFTSLEREVK